MSKNILALDLGTQTGWAISTSSESFVHSGTVSFKSGRYEGGGMRFLRFRRWLDEWCVVDEIYFEEVRRHIGTDAAHVYGGLLATLTSWAEERKIPYQGIPVGTIKKHATGKGNASKELVQTAVKEWGFSPKDDNEADAIALLHCVLEGEF